MGATLQGDGWHVEEIVSGSPRILARSAVAVSVTGTTNETVLATVTIPPGMVLANGGLLIYSAWTTTNNANTKTPRIRLGGAAGTQYYSPALTTSVSEGAITRIRNRGAVNSQVGGGANTSQTGLGISSLALPTSAVDFAAAVDLVFSAQLGVGTDTATLESYEVWLLP